MAVKQFSYKTLAWVTDQRCVSILFSQSFNLQFWNSSINLKRIYLEWGHLNSLQGKTFFFQDENWTKFLKYDVYSKPCLIQYNIYLSWGLFLQRFFFSHRFTSHFKLLLRFRNVLKKFQLSLGKIVLIYVDLSFLGAFRLHSIKFWWLLFSRQLYHIKYYKYSAFLLQCCH